MNIVCIAAAGSGTRMSHPKINKQFLPIEGKPFIAHCVGTFNISEIDEIILAVQKIHIPQTTWMMNTFCKNAKVHIIEGGDSRNKTIENMVNYAINSFDLKSDDVILTHDSARPLITKDLILDSLALAMTTDCAGVAIPSSDSVYISKDGETLEGIADRKTIYLAQTPQSFKVNSWNKIKDSLTEEDLYSDLDICSLFLKYGLDVKFSKGDSKNIKVTFDEDYNLAKAYMVLRKNKGAD